MTLMTIPVPRLIEHFDPLSGMNWNCRRVTVEEVLDAPELHPEPLPSPRDLEERALYNAGRVAALLQTGWPLAEDDDEPVVVSVEFHPASGPVIEVADGNHRVAAASIRGDEQIQVWIEGDVDTAINVFLLGMDYQPDLDDLDPDED